MAPAPEVLIVEDDPDMLELMASLVARRSVYAPRISAVASAEAAFPLLAAHEFALIITDYRLEKGSGIDVLEAAFETRPKARRLLLTAFGSETLANDAVLRGHIDAFIAKPFDFAKFIRLVDSLLAASAVPTMGS